MNLHVETPVVESRPISDCLGRRVLLKMECFQPAGSFKIRGIGRLCEELVRSGVSQLISSSGGNAGYAVAFAGRRLGVKVIVVVPETTPPAVRRKIALEGADVRVHGAVWDEADAYAHRLCEATGGGYVSPFDHPTIWAGHSTIIDEMALQCPRRPDVIVLSVGGGGLLCGVVEGFERLRWDDVRIVAVETEGADSLAASLEAGRLVTLPAVTSIATSLGTRQVAPKAFEYARERGVVSVTVPDASAVRACLQFADDHRVLVEPACGAALSVVYDERREIAFADTVLVIVCGGVGVDRRRLAEWEGQFPR